MLDDAEPVVPELTTICASCIQSSANDGVVHRVQLQLHFYYLFTLLTAVFIINVCTARHVGGL